MSVAKIGLYGGTFDPIHLGHLIVGRSVLEQLALDELIFIPSAQPPHKGRAPISDIHHRAQMVKLAIKDETGFSFDDCEMKRPGPSYTLDTVEHFQQRYGPEARIMWILGADSLPELDSWHRFSELVDACDIITTCRPGWEGCDLKKFERSLKPEQLDKLRQGIIETPRIDIASTDIRARLATGKSIRYLVPVPVRQYIHGHQLYTSAPNQH